MKYENEINEVIKNKLENYKEELRRQKVARLKKGDTTKSKHIRKLKAKVKLYEGFLNDEKNTNARYVYRKLQKNENYSVMEIGENDNPRTHPREWCDRRVCEGFWGNEEEAKRWVAKMNEV